MIFHVYKCINGSLCDLLYHEAFPFFLFFFFFFTLMSLMEILCSTRRQFYSTLRNVTCYSIRLPNEKTKKKKRQEKQLKIPKFPALEKKKEKSGIPINFRLVWQTIFQIVGENSGGRLNLELLRLGEFSGLPWGTGSNRTAKHLNETIHRRPWEFALLRVVSR